jgi:2-C-methyl-D-erythritol 2,4-cyclodiphosphate synthase
MTLRIGQGYDIHALVPGRKLLIGGVDIPFDRGLLGHSDGDVLLHAICDALLGAAGLGDIGGRFPDTDQSLSGADSGALLATVGREVSQRGFSVVNIDSTIIAQAPRMASHIPTMVANVAALLGIDASQINIKAQTNERRGGRGRGEGIAAQAVVLIETAGG